MNRSLSLSLAGALVGGLLAVAPTASAAPVTAAPVARAPLAQAPVGTAETRLSDQVAPGGLGETDVAFDPVTNRFLTVWSTSTVLDAARGSAGVRQSISARYVDARTGTPDGAEFSIVNGAATTGDLDAVEPSVAYDPVERRFVVAFAWDTLADATGTVDRTAFRVHGVTVSGTTVGTPVALGPAPTGERDDRDPDVTGAASGDVYVAYESTNATGVVEAKVLRASGAALAVTGSRTVGAFSGAGDAQDPAVAVQADGAVAVVWTGSTSSSPTPVLFLVAVPAGLTGVSGGGQPAAGVEVSGATVAAEVGRPGVVLAWSEQPSAGTARVRTARLVVNPGGINSVTPQAALAPSAADQLWPTVSANADGQGIVSWIERAGTDHQLRTARFDPTAASPTPIEPATLSTRRGTANTEPTRPAVAWSKATVGTSYTTWSGEADLAVGESEAWGRLDQGPRRAEADLLSTVTVAPNDPAAPVAGVEPGDVMTWTLGFGSATTSATEVDDAVLTLGNDAGADITDLAGSTTVTAPGVTVTQTSSSPLTWTVSGLDPGESGTITVQSRFVAGRPSGTVASRTSTISAPGNTDAVPANDSATATATADNRPFVVSVASPAGPVRTGATSTITFSEPVTGFTPSDVTTAPTTGTAQASVTAVECSGTTCTVALATTGDGTVGVVVPATATATDASGKPLSTGNLPVQGGQTVVDNSGPVAVFDAPAGPVRGAFGVSVIFNESVTGLTLEDFVPTNATIGSFAGSGTTYTIVVNPVADGAVTLALPEGAATDAAGNGSAAVSLTRQYDGTRPGVTLSAPAGPFNAPFRVSATFTEPVEGFTASDVSVTGGAVSDLQGSGASWSVLVTPSSQGSVTVDVPADVATDAAGNGNTAASSLVRTFDSVAPTAALTSSSPPLVRGAFEATLTFSEPVTGLVLGDLTVVNAELSGLAGSGASYTFTVTPSGDGQVSVVLSQRSVQDAADNGNVASNPLVRTADVTRPTVTLTAAAGPFREPFTVTATFSEPVTGLTADDVAVSNGAVTALAGSGTTWTATVTPGADGDVVVGLPAGAALDAAGNPNTAATPITRAFDATRPTVTLGAPAGPVNAPFTVTVTFSEPVTGLEPSDLSVVNGTVSDLAGSGTTWTVRVTPVADGDVVVGLPAGATADGAGNTSTAADPLTRVFDSVRPSVTLAAAAGPVDGPFEVTIAFSEAVSGLALDDVVVANGTATGLTGTGDTYTVTVTPTADGTVTVDLPAGAAADAAGNASTAAERLTRAADLTRPSVVLSAPEGPFDAPFTVTATFSSPVTGWSRPTSPSSTVRSRTSPGRARPTRRRSRRRPTARSGSHCPPARRATTPATPAAPRLPSRGRTTPPRRSSRSPAHPVSPTRCAPGGSSSWSPPTSR